MSDSLNPADQWATRMIPFGPVSLRRMFGGCGLFYQGLMIGLIDGEKLYLKADPVAVPMFRELDCEQFTYRRQGRSIGMSYYRAPDHMFDSPDDTLRWGTVAYESALRAQAAKPSRRRPKLAKSTFTGPRI